MQASTVDVNTVVFFAKTNCALGFVVCYYDKHASGEKDSYDINQLSRINFNITV